MTKQSEIDKQILNSRIPTRARTLLYTISSRDTDEVLYRLKMSDLANIKFAKSIYEGYQRAKKRTGSSLNYYCFILSTEEKNKPVSYFKNWYKIYRHFCVRINFDPTEIIGIDYRILKFIAESGIKTMNATVTREIVAHLKDSILGQQNKWNYVRDKKNIIKSLNKSFISDKSTDAPKKNYT